MPEEVASLAGRAAPWLLNYLLHSTVLIAAVWLLDRGGVVRRARTLDLLWKAALLAGLVTATAGVGRAALVGRRAVADVEAVVHREVGTPLAGALTWVAPQGRAGAATRFRARVRARVVEPSPECRRVIEDGAGGGEAWIGALKAACVPDGFDGRAMLVLAWLAGAATLLLFGVRDRRRLSAVLAGCAPADGRVAAIGAPLVANGPGRARIVVSGMVPAPCAVGRCVVLPARCASEMDDGELTAVLAHELAHVQRRDPWWLAVADAVRRLAWIQPLNRLAAAGLRDAAELMTDQQTLRHTRPLDLARSIHRVSHWAIGHGPAARVAGLARPRDGSLTRRVRRILAPVSERGVGPAWPGVLLVLALAGGAMLLPPVAMTRELRAVLIERVQGPLRDAGAEQPVVDMW
jgi:hypothetical protein